MQRHEDGWLRGSTELAASPTAQIAVEYDFNPDQRDDVSRIKLLAAALITELENARRGAGPVGARRASIAITAAEEASIRGVGALFR